MAPVGLDSTASFCVVQLTMLLDSRRDRPQQSSRRRRRPELKTGGLTAPTGRAAAHAAIAAPIAHHDYAADTAARCVAHVIEIAHGVRCVVDAAIL